MTSTAEIPNAYNEPDLLRPDLAQCHPWLSTEGLPVTSIFRQVHHGHIRACAAAAVETVSVYGSASVDIIPGDSTVYAATVIDQQFINTPHHPDHRWALSFGQKFDGTAGRVYTALAHQAHMSTDTYIETMTCTTRQPTNVIAWIYTAYLTNILTGLTLPWLHQDATA